MREFIDRSVVFHSSVVLGELAAGVANADPTRSRWTQLRTYYADLFASIPLTRLVAPDDLTWVDAGIVAGTLARTQGFQPHQRKECLNDALVMIGAAKSGIPVLTANRDDFDLIQQLVPTARFVHY
jgi:predicted nucleic acid-binding protein